MKKRDINFDLTISNGLVMDPRTNTTASLNLGIIAGKIEKVSPEELPGNENIDAHGCVVTPGFIDIHSHIDGNEYMGGLSALQGITTTMTGNCGFSVFPIKDFLNSMDEGFIINIGTFIGHSWTLREMAGVPDPYTKITSLQIDKMTRLATQALEDGAFGISLGIEYAPATTYQEIVMLTAIAQRFNSFIPIHPRGDVRKLEDSLEEIFALKRDTGARVHISHLTYNYGYGMLSEAIKLIEKADSDGLQITCDSGAYPYFATYIGTPTFDPGWLDELGCSLNDLVISSGPHVGKICNKKLFAEIRKYAPLTVGTVLASGKEEEMLKALTLPYVVFSTDAAVAKEPGCGHPQDSGTYPRIIGTYVREKNLIPLMTALKKSSDQVARILNLPDKGWIGEGADADLVIFDPTVIKDKSDYLTRGRPNLPPMGIKTVLVNGVTVTRNGKLTGAKPGKAIRPKI